jgi:hypothetical protein
MIDRMKKNKEINCEGCNLTDEVLNLFFKNYQFESHKLYGN